VNRRVLLLGLVVALPLLGVLTANLGRDPRVVDSPLVGRPAPPFTLAPVGGGEAMSLAALRGRPVVVNFWASWCAPCDEEHPVLTQAARSLAGDVHFVGVVYEDTEPNAAAYLKQRGSAFPSLVDPGSRTAIAYGVFGVPETYFIDAQGTIVSKFVGPLRPETLEALVEKARGRAR
jgi:cytochrome c biogenesis protein CcmG/thiol:disulfide interchange protein DsbE